MDDSFYYLWPSAVNVYSEKGLEVIKKELDKKRMWIATEQLEGLQCSLSSDGILAQRKDNLGDDWMDENEKIPFFEGTYLGDFCYLYQKLPSLKKSLARWLPENISKKFEIILYGQFVLEKFAKSFHYRDKKIEGGDFYVFGLGIVTDNYSNGDFYDLEQEFKIELECLDKWEFCGLWGEYHVTPLNEHLRKELLSHGIDKLAPIYGCGELKKLLSSSLAQDLALREVKGLVLTSNECEIFLKWPAPKKEKCFSNKIQILLQEHPDVANTLSSLCHHVHCDHHCRFKKTKRKVGEMGPT